MMRRWQGIVFILAAATAAHLAYGHLGFNPTDEGYLLSGSRRLLDGQIPHRDYLSLRPVGTHLLHAHLLLWSGDRLIWWSRFIAWLQISVIAWLWASMAGTSFGILGAFPARTCLGLVGVAATAHWFPVMPWNTLDAILFFSIGMALRATGNRQAALASHLVIGTTVLFRQNFALVLPLWMLLSEDRRRAASWLALLAPGLLYALALFAFDAWGDAVAQLTSHRLQSVQAVGFLSDPPFLAGLALGFLWLALLRWTRLHFALRLIVIALVFGAALYVLDVPRTPIRLLASWLPIGAVIGTAPMWWRSETSARRIILLSLLMAWVVSISEGWPRPGLGAFPPMAMLVGIVMAGERRHPALQGVILPAVAAIVLLAILLVDFHRERTRNVYYDRTAAELRYDVGEVLRGGRGIFTNHDMFEMLRELKHWVETIEQRERRYAILHELSQHWVTSHQPNPLSCDWPSRPELADPVLRDRVLREINAVKGKVSFIVQKRSAYGIAWGVRFPPSIESSPASEAVKSRFRKVDEGPYFGIYE